MRSTPLLFLAVLLVAAPSTGLAQESAGGLTPPLPALREPDAPLSDKSFRLAPEAAPSTSRSGRIISGALVGTFAAAAGGVAGLLGGSALSAHSCSLFNSCSLTQAPKPYLGFMLGSALGSSIAYYAVGSNWSGQGHFLPTLLGATAAVGLYAVPVFAGAMAQDRLLLSPFVAAVGATIAYEISHSINDTSPGSGAAGTPARRSESSGVQMVPVLGATSGGGMLGLAGTF